MEIDPTNPMPQPEAAPASKEAGEFVKCPCCGQMTLHKPVKPGDDMMDHFMACMLTGTPYKYTYELYGGRIHVTVTQITNDIRKYVMDACSLLDRWADITLDSSSQIAEIKDLVRTYSCILDITVDNGTARVFYPADAMKKVCEAVISLHGDVAAGKLDAQAVGAKVDELLNMAKDPGSISSLPATMLMAAFQLHNQLFQIMMDAGFDENFWARIKLE